MMCQTDKKGCNKMKNCKLCEEREKENIKKIFKHSRLYSEAPVLLLQNTELGREICILELIALMMENGREEDFLDEFLMHIKETAEQHCTEDEGKRLVENLRFAISSFGTSVITEVLLNMGESERYIDKDIKFIDCYRIIKRRTMGNAWPFSELPKAV